MKSDQRTAIARRCLTAVAHACHAIGAGCGGLRRLAKAPHHHSTRHMRNSAIILAALLTARPTLAAEQCLEVKPNPNIDPALEPTYAKYADTAHCFLRVDGKVIINRTCHIGIFGDTHEWAMNGVAEVYMNRDLPDRP